MSTQKPVGQDELMRLRREVAALQVKLAPVQDGYQTDVYWAAWTGQDVETFRRFVKQHGIPCSRFGLRVCVRKEAIEAFLDANAGRPFHGSKAKKKRSPGKR